MVCVCNSSSAETTMRNPLGLNPIDHKKKKAKPCPLTRAHKILPRLGLHAFIKYPLSHSDVKTSISIPSHQCRRYLSRNEKIVTLVNERGHEYKVHFLRRSNQLASGWIRFSALNNLYEGDCLVFQSIGYFKFKVFIFRKNDSAESDSTNTSTHESDSANDIDEEDEDHASTHETSPENDSAGVDSTNAGTEETGPAKKRRKTCPKQIPEENIEQCEDIFLCTEQDATSPRSSLDFKEVKKFEDFNIVINGLNIDSVVSEQVRMDYYKLCRSQKSYLHDNILKDIYDPKWAANIISRIVNIANAIKACKLSTPPTVYTSWDKILYSFEVLGMNVEFLRARLRRLGRLSVDSEDEMLRTQIVEAKQELLDIEEKITTLKEKKEELALVIVGKKAILDRREQKFQKEAIAPW